MLSVRDGRTYVHSEIWKHLRAKKMVLCTELLAAMYFCIRPPISPWNTVRPSSLLNCTRSSIYCYIVHSVILLVIKPPPP
mgnify:FL=1